VIYLYMESFQLNILDRIPFFRSSHHLHAPANVGPKISLAATPIVPPVAHEAAESK